MNDIEDFVRVKFRSLDRASIMYSETWQIVFSCKCVNFIKYCHDHRRAHKREEREPVAHRTIDTDGTMSDEAYLQHFHTAYQTLVQELSVPLNDDVVQQINTAKGVYYDIYRVSTEHFYDISAKILVLEDMEKLFKWW